MFLGFGPDDEHVRDRRIADPCFRSVEGIALAGADGPCVHSSGVGAGVRFGQAEAAYFRSCGEAGEVFLPLLFRAPFPDREHHQRGLHRHSRAVAGVDALDFAGDEAVGNIIGACAAVFFGQCGTEQAEFAHFLEDCRVESGFTVSLDDARHQAVLCVGTGGVADGPLLFGQAVFDP